MESKEGTGEMMKKSTIEDINEKRATIKRMKGEKFVSPHIDEGTKEQKVSVGYLKTLIGEGEHRHTVIESSHTDADTVTGPKVHNDASVKVGDSKNGKELQSKAQQATPGLELVVHKQSEESTNSQRHSTSNLKSSSGQGASQPLILCGHRCTIVGTLAVSSGLEWTDALRHPASLGFKDVEMKVTKALTAVLWQTKFGEYLDFMEVAAFVPGRVDPVVLVDVLLQFSNFNIKLTAHLLFQAIMEQVDKGRLPETQFKVDFSKTYFLMRSSDQEAGNSMSCRDDNLEVPRWAWLALTGGITSVGIIAVTGSIVVLRRYWRSGPRLSK